MNIVANPCAAYIQFIKELIGVILQITIIAPSLYFYNLGNFHINFVNVVIRYLCKNTIVKEFLKLLLLLITYKSTPLCQFSIRKEQNGLIIFIYSMMHFNTILYYIQKCKKLIYIYKFYVNYIIKSIICMNICSICVVQ